MAYTAYVVGKQRGTPVVFPLASVRGKTRDGFLLEGGKVAGEGSVRLCKGAAKPDPYVFHGDGCLLAFGVYFDEVIMEDTNPRNPGYGGLFRPGDAFKGASFKEFRYGLMSTGSEAAAPSQAEMTGIDAYTFYGEQQRANFKTVVARYNAQDKTQGAPSAEALAIRQARAQDAKIARLAASPKKAYECEMDQATRASEPYPSATVKCKGLVEPTGLTYAELMQAGFEFVSSAPHSARTFETFAGGYATEHRLRFVVRMP